MKKTAFCSILVMISLAMVVALAGNTDAASKKKQVTDEKTVSGTVTVIRDTYIAVEFQPDYEMIFPIDDSVTFQNTDISKLQEGDTINVSYEDLMDVDDTGAQKFEKRVAKNVKFLSHASKSLKSK